MVRQLNRAMVAALLMAVAGAAADPRPVTRPVTGAVRPADGACPAACTSARAACRDGAYRQGCQELAALRRGAEPPLSAPEIASFMRRERERLGLCEAQRAACVQKCQGTDTRPGERAVDDSVHRSQR